VNEGRMSVLFRGRCGAWVLEKPDGEIVDLKATDAAREYMDFYGLLDDHIAPYDGDETCVHGTALTENCEECYEEYMLQQLAVTKVHEGESLEDTIKFALGFIDSPFEEQFVGAIIADVYKNLVYKNLRERDPEA